MYMYMEKMLHLRAIKDEEKEKQNVITVQKNLS